MKKVLLLYATMEGQTEKIARRIASHLESSGCEVTLENVARLKDEQIAGLEDYDQLVFGASIHIGRIEKDLLDFINSHAEQINRKPHFLFIVLMAAATKDESSRNRALGEIASYLDKALQVNFSDKKMFAGAIMYTKYNWFTKWAMKRIARKEGGSTDTTRDHEYTDWEEVAEYARMLSES